MSEVTDASPSTRRKRRRLTIAVVVLVVVALVTVVSVLTGGNVTNAPTSDLTGTHVKAFTLPGLASGTIAAPWKDHHASVLFFFASWCPPCKGEIPKVAAYLSAHAPKHVDVLGIDANDDRGAATTFVQHAGVHFPVAFDAHGTVTSGEFLFAQLPEAVFVNAQGVVTQVHFGAITLPELRSGLRQLTA